MTASHLLVHRSVDKRRFYDEANPLLWSDELECWTTSGRETILQILKSKDFHVVDYGGESLRLSRRLKIDFLATQELLAYVPLGHEGGHHAVLRKKMAIAVRDKSAGALAAFAACARERVTAALVPGSTFDIVGEIFEPCVGRLMLALSGVLLEPDDDAISPSQVFDKTLSVNRRKRLNRRVTRLLDKAKANIASDAPVLDAALVVVGSDSLLGSMIESFVLEVRRSAGRRLSEIDWSKKLPSTAVPYVERVAIKPCQIAETEIEPGQRIRLYLDALELGGPDAHDFFFGAGRHVCLGKSISTQAWQILTSLFREIDRRVSIDAVSYRRSDYVFNVPDHVKVVVHDD